MAKFNLAVFRKGKPIYWIVGAVVLFVLFYFMASKGAPKASSGGGTTYVESGPSEAELSAQVALAGISAQTNSDAARVAGETAIARSQMETQIGLAQINATIAAADIAANRELSALALTTDRDNQRAQLEASLDAINLQAQYGTEQARIATQGSIQALQIQTQAQQAMYMEQSRALGQQALIAQASTLKKKDRDNFLAGLAGLSNYRGVDYRPAQ